MQKGRTVRPSRKRPLKSQIALLLSVLGPGIIAANADNDAGGIFQYSQAGAQFGYTLLWVLVLVTISLGVCQEMGARMGAATGKGLADLIREEYGVKVTLFALATLLIANYATTVSEFAGITAAVEMFVPPGRQMMVRWTVVPLTAFLVWMLVTRSNYKRVERVLLTLSLIYLAYIASAYLAHPPWRSVVAQTVWPDMRGIRIDQNYILMIVGLIGTTITPWGQFYIQSSVRDKGIRKEDYWVTRADVLFGAFFTNFIAFFIIVCCAAKLFDPGLPADRFQDAGAIAGALAPVAGNWAATLFAIGLFNASCVGAITVPVSTAYAITESLGSESALGRRTREAPLFIGVLSLLLIVSAATVLFSHKLQTLILLPNIVGGMLLPIILVLTLRLVNNRRIMGRYTNSLVYNVIAWITTIVLILLSAVLIWQGVLQILGKS